MAKLLDFDGKHRDDIIVLSTPSGLRVTITRDHLVQMIAGGHQSLSLLGLGKRVAGLMARFRVEGALTPRTNRDITNWLGAFDGQIPPRFSSQVAANLLEVMTWPGADDHTKQRVDSFIRTYPRLMTPTQQPSGGRTT